MLCMLCCCQIEIGPLVIIDTDPKEKQKRKRRALSPDFSPVVKPKARSKAKPKKAQGLCNYAFVGCLNDHHGLLFISIGGQVLCVGGEFSQEGQ